MQANAYSVIPAAVAYIRLYGPPRFALDDDGSRGGWMYVCEREREREKT